MSIDRSGYLPPFNNNILYPNITAVASDYEHLKRITKYLQYWKFYKGEHWSYSREAQTGDPTVTINYSNAIVDKHINFLMKKGFDIAIPDLPDTAQNDTINKQFIKNLLDATWENNKKTLWAYDCAQSGGVSGDVFLYFSWKENDPFNDPYVKVDVIPSEFCFPKFNTNYGAARELEEFTLVYPIYTLNKNNVTNSDLVMRTEVWTSTTHTVHEGTERIVNDINPYGEIPIVHIANLPIIGEYFGLSDLFNIIGLQREFNEKCTDISDIIQHFAAPLTVIYGAKSSDLSRAVGRTWFMPEGSSVDIKDPSDSIASSVTYLKLLRQFMFELSGMPEQALGHNESRSSQEAASAMAIDYLPMTDRRALKENLYGYGIKLANRLIIKINELFDKDFRRKMEALPGGRTKYLTKVTFPEPFPRNDDLALDRATKKLNLQLITRQRALQELGYEEADARRLVDEAMKEQETSFNNTVNEVKTGPNPTVQGEKKSKTAEIDKNY